MMQDSGRPLHRLTPLRDDPAVAWLTKPQRLRITLTGWFGWLGFVTFMWLTWWALVLLMLGVFGVVDFRLAGIATMLSAFALVWPARRIVMRRQNRKLASMVRETTPATAIAVDDFGDLDKQSDGAVVSVVGWIRARGQLPDRVAGEPAIGVALACHQKYPGVLETLNDFDLVDEGGRTILVQVAGARMLGPSNVDLTDFHARRLLVASLDLPVGAVATGWDAFVLRDGDPVMIVGFKQTRLDPTQASLRAPPASASVASLPPKPLLIFPIAAERRAQVTSMLNLS
jgi:hypothetical protein